MSITPVSVEAPGPRVGERHYGGDHHRLSVVDQLGARMEMGLRDGVIDRDPTLIAKLLPVLDGLLAYFDPEVESFERLPRTGPMLLVSNHSGGIYMPDYWAFHRHWIRERGLEEPLYALGLDLIFSLPFLASTARRLGAVPANPGNASHLLAEGFSVLVYPGGEEDDYRPWMDRNRVDLHGRTGFVRLALRHRVPVVPLVNHGSHNIITVLSRGETIARLLGLDRVRVKILPLVAGLPWLVAPMPLPTLPLPAKVSVRVCEPFDWSAFGSDAAEDPAVVRRCYEEILGRMQSNLDEMVAEAPHPLMARLRDPARRGSLARGNRP